MTIILQCANRSNNQTSPPSTFKDVINHLMVKAQFMGENTKIKNLRKKS